MMENQKRRYNLCMLQTHSKKPKPNIEKPEPVSSDDLSILVKKNIEWSEVIFEQNKKIKNRLTMMVIGDYLKLFLIIAPIIFAIIYLPPLIQSVAKQYGGILGGNVSGSSMNVQKILDQLNKQGVIHK